MRRIMLSAMACPALQYISTLFPERHNFRKKSYWIQNVCFDFSWKFLWNISHHRKNWARYDHKSMLVFM